MRDFVQEHRALLLKHARLYVRATADKIHAEDVAREMELEITQLAKERGLTTAQIASPDAFLRSLVKHSAGRAKRRRKLIEQVAAGDDLQAFSDDLAALDRDLPEPISASSTESAAARATLERVKASLGPRDALVFALVIEDDSTIEDVARALSMPLSDVKDTMKRIIAAANDRGIEPPDSQAQGLA